MIDVHTAGAWCEGQAYTVSLLDLGLEYSTNTQVADHIPWGLRTWEALNQIEEQVGIRTQYALNAPTFCDIICFQHSKPAAKNAVSQ